MSRTAIIAAGLDLAAQDLLVSSLFGQNVGCNADWNCSAYDLGCGRFLLDLEDGVWSVTTRTFNADEEEYAYSDEVSGSLATVLDYLNA